VTRRRRNVVVGGVLAVGLVLGVLLVVSGGGDGADQDASTTSTGSIPPSAAASEPLPLDDLSRSGVEALAGLQLPPSASDFLTARLADDAQLDVTFTMEPDEEAAFIEASGLPEPVADERVILHSSPLWKLNPDDAAIIRGAADDAGSVERAVELVDEGDRVRARVVIISAD
jgi:hypothetical protein